MTLTEWYDGDQKLVNEGLYQRDQFLPWRGVTKADALIKHGKEVTT